MKKNLLNFCLLIAVGFAAVVFTSCNGEEPQFESGDIYIIANNVIDSSDEIARVQMKTDNVVFHTLYQNHGFTMFISGILVYEHLESITRFFGHQDITSSDENAKWFVINFLDALNSENVSIGRLAFINSDKNNWCEEVWIYADRDVTVKCSGEVTEISVNLNLNKGWNNVYVHINQISPIANEVRITTDKPSGMDFRWHFIPWQDGDNNTK